MSQKKEQQGYGNIYTPHAGSMIIQVQREGGLANRTIVLSPRRVRLLRFVMSRTGIVIGIVLGAMFLFFAVQAARVPVLTSRLANFERDAQRLDTLEQTLAHLTKRYEQVQTMLGAKPTRRDSMQTVRADSAPATRQIPKATAARQNVPIEAIRGTLPTPAPATIPPAATRPAAMLPASPPPPIATIPSRFPIDAKYFVTRGVGSGAEYGATHPGVDVAVASGTEVRAAGGGSVVEVSETTEYGKMVRVAHPGGYETLYGHLSEARVRQGDRVALGTTLGLSGNTGRSTAPHLHFELRKGGAAVDPMTLIQQSARQQ